MYYSCAQVEKDKMGILGIREELEYLEDLAVDGRTILEIF
jgi:hypothetical protein